MSICHAHVQMPEFSGLIGVTLVTLFSFSTIIGNFFEFESQVKTSFNKEIILWKFKTIKIIFSQIQVTYTVDYEPGMLQVGANNYTFTDVHPTSLRVDPAYSKVKNLVLLKPWKGFIHSIGIKLYISLDVFKGPFYLLILWSIKDY